MAMINWSNDFSVKVASIDEQHKKLVELVNLLNELTTYTVIKKTDMAYSGFLSEKGAK